MKPFQLSTLAILLQAYVAAAQVDVIQVDGDVDISKDGKTIHYQDPNCKPSPSWTCDASRTCNDETVWSLDATEDYATCCRPGKHLSGSIDTEFYCCAKGHEVAGSDDVGYSCCPEGYDYDGKCKEVCKNGKKLVNGKCVCPKGTVEGPDGECREKKTPEACSSGLKTGKCYTFGASNGHLLGRRSNGEYHAGPDSMSQRWGKFKLCKDEKCKSGQPVNPSDAVYIKDIHGDVKNGKNVGEWLDARSDGDHIESTSDFKKAGEFALTKWPCGKYCLGGVEHGVGPACPSDNPAITFYSEDPQMCMPFELTEVPCDVKADRNNCIWTNGEDQCCDKMHCPDDCCTCRA